MADFSAADLDSMLSEARRTLESMRSGSAPADPAAEGEAVQGVGEAAEGRVKATASVGGRLKSVELDPRAMRMASAELGEQLVLAVNAALDDLRANSAGAAAAAAGAPDVEALGRQVEQVQNEGMRQMEMITQALSDTISKIGGRR